MSHRVLLTVMLAAAAVLAACTASNGVAGPAAGTPADSAMTSIEPYENRFGRDRPIVAVLTHGDGGEVTDFVVPYGVIEASGEAEVLAVSTAPGPVEMFPALTVEPDLTTREFDRRYPEGADYVIVPAVHKSRDPQLLAWIRAQAERGATLVGVCDGVLVLANAGVLEGRSATAHWFSIDRLERRHSGTRWMRNQRYVADESVVTTAGVSASVPISVALVEAIAGREKAEELAASLGVGDWSAAHDSALYTLRGHIGTALANRLAFWRREAVGIEIAPESDEITLALQADLWSRTYRSRAFTIAGSEAPIVTRSGLRIVPDRIRGGAWEPDRMVEALDASSTGVAIPFALDAIEEAYGAPTAAFVAVQIEYPWDS